MNNFAKIYISIIGAVLLFSGFWYVKAYFGYFSMNEIPPTLGPDFIIQVSFAVLYKLLTFDDPKNSLYFFALLIVLFVLAYGLPEVRLSLGGKVGDWVRRTWGRNVVPLFPNSLRMVIAAGLSFMTLYHLSAEAGLTDACRVLRNQMSITTSVEPQFVSDLHPLWKKGEEKFLEKFYYRGPDPSSKKEDKAAAKLPGQKPKQDVFLVQLWRTAETVYLGTAVEDCADKRVVYKLLTKHLPVTRHMVEGK